MRLARRYLISGRVQGVGFRFFTERAAAREGLHGWVRNTRDGTVEIRAEGDVDALERFERAITHGPPQARVDHVDITDLGADGRDIGFSVRPSGE
jgi:acylphosphatase